VINYAQAMDGFNSLGKKIPQLQSKNLNQLVGTYPSMI